MLKVTKLIIDCAYRLHDEILRVLRYICLICIDLKLGLGSGFGEPDNTSPPPPPTTTHPRTQTHTTNSQEYPPCNCQLIIDSVYFMSKKSRRVTSLPLPNRYWSEIRGGPFDFRWGGGCGIFRLLDIFFIAPALQDFFFNLPVLA